MYISDGILYVIAPSAPRDVTARLVNTPVVEIRWREPASINGIVTYYIVYAQAPMILLSLGGGQSVPSSLGEASLVRAQLNVYVYMIALGLILCNQVNNYYLFSYSLHTIKFKGELCTLMVALLFGNRHFIHS